jgi:hypothetical protein
LLLSQIKEAFNMPPIPLGSGEAEGKKEKKKRGGGRDSRKSAL